MKYDFAPMEGITDAVFRRVHHKYFPGVDRYYMPFISPTIHRSLTNREARELPAADSVDFVAVPQLLGKNVEDMLWAINVCREQGYGVVNINMGCPSGTVVSKGKGSGMLADPEELDRFLDKLYSAATLPVSIKTRIGMTDPEEFPKILEVFNQYPLAELIIHPRVRKAFYEGVCNLDAFQMAVDSCKFPLCYNGNLNCLEDISRISEKFPTVKTVMIGRSLVANPGMLTPEGTTRNHLELFMNELSEAYAIAFGSKRNTIFRLKENWHYLISLFENGEKHWKQLRKTTDYDTFQSISNDIIHNLPMRKDCVPTW